MKNDLYYHSQRGSALIVAMIMTAIIGISLASYIRLGITSQTISNRALYNNGAMNLAENGLEEAMYSINKMVADPTYNWSGWTVDSSNLANAYRRFPSNNGTYAFDQNAKGFVRVYVYNYKGINAPRIATRSTISLGGNTSAPIEKWVYVELSKTSKFSNGLVAKDTILFKGANASVDSWASDPKNDGSFTPFSDSVKNDNGSVGSVSVSVDSVMVQNADIWGYVSTNNAQDPTKNVGAKGSILGEDSKPDASWTNTNVDPSRVSTQFSANFDPVTSPTVTTSIGSITSTTTLGSDGVTQTITVDNITLGGNLEKLTIKGDVTLIIPVSAGDSAIKITGNSAGITIAPGGSLKLYTAGAVLVGGTGITNSTGAPKNLQIYGTSTTSQVMDIVGGGSYSGVIYAPNASVTIRGDGDMWGSVVAKDIFINGTAKFHYDESLANMNTGNPFRVAVWRELTKEDVPSTTIDRAGQRPKLSF